MLVFPTALLCCALCGWILMNHRILQCPHDKNHTKFTVILPVFMAIFRKNDSPKTGVHGFLEVQI
jgi:hypothetical protein